MKIATQLVILMVLAAIPAITSVCTSDVPIVSATGSTYQDGNQDFQAIDGNLTSRWSAKGVGVYITLDLGKLVKLCSVSVAWYQGDTRVNFFDLSTSLDNVAYTQVYSGNSSLTTNFQTYEINVRSARYVRLTFRGNTVSEWCSINEIKVSEGFSHPGVLLNPEMITFVRNKIAAAQEPWKTMLARLKSNSRASLSYTAIPVSVMYCGQEKPTATDVGCTRSRNDALAAWTQTLIWAYTGDQNYSNNAIRILNAWSSTLTKITFNGSDVLTKNGPLNAAWLGEMFTRSAELLRYYNAGWSASDALRFQNMLTNVIQPMIKDGWKYGNGNWDLSMIDALGSIGVFANNKTTFDKAVSLWRTRVPQYIYISSDGATPVPNCCDNVYTLWNQTVFDSRLNGLVQETCRDFGHTQMGLAAMVNFAETAYQQGVDLYNEAKNRLTAAFEFNSKYLNLNKEIVDSFLCRGVVRLVDDLPSWEIGYNHLNTRLGISLPQTSTLITRMRSNGPFYVDLMMAWDTLTHAGTGWSGLP